jgi:hypothetical protein
VFKKVSGNILNGLKLKPGSIDFFMNQATIANEAHISIIAVENGRQNIKIYRAISITLSQILIILSLLLFIFS